MVLFGLLLAETQATIQLFSEDDAAVVTDPDKKGLTLEEVMAILTELRKLSNDQTHHQALATRQSHSGPPPSDDRQRGMGFGSRAAGIHVPWA